MFNKNYIFLFMLLFNKAWSYNVGLCIVATGKYINFVEPLIASAEKYFLKNHKVTYFVFTDGNAPKQDNIVSIYQKKLGWPYDTMMRFYMYYKNKDILSEMDFLYSCDADMLFVDSIGNEIIGNRVVVCHPGYIDKRGTYETNSISKACVSLMESVNAYYAGGFWGGLKKEFLHACKINNANIKEDLKKKYIAIWHDESHHNRYFIDNKPDVILTPSYCYPEGWNLSQYKPKLIALNKKHDEIRKD